MTAPARPRGWGHPSVTQPWCVCPECDELAFHLMPERYGYRLFRECMGCGNTWTEFAWHPNHSPHDCCAVAGCEYQRPECEATH